MIAPASTTNQRTGVGALSTRQVIAYARQAKDAGATSLMLEMQQFFPISFDAAYQHYADVAAAVELEGGHLAKIVLVGAVLVGGFLLIGGGSALALAYAAFKGRQHATNTKPDTPPPGTSGAKANAEKAACSSVRLRGWRPPSTAEAMSLAPKEWPMRTGWSWTLP